MSDLDTVKAKLVDGWTLGNLPKDRADPLWTEVRSTCDLSGPEVSLLKNEVDRLNTIRKAVIWLKKQKESIEFGSYAEMIEQVESVQRWKKILIFSEYVVKYKTSTDSFDVRKDLQGLPAVDPLVFYIDFKSREFSVAAKEVEDALSSIGSLYKSVDVILEDTSFFLPSTSMDHKSAAEKVVSCLRDKCRAINLSMASEYTMREFISPVLIEVVLVVAKHWKDIYPCDKGQLTLVCDRTILGLRTHGPVDYSILLDWIDLVLSEAKQGDLNAGIVQNLLQQHACKEFLANTTVDYQAKGEARKRKFVETFNQISYQPTYGIVSTGYEWVLTTIRPRLNNGMPVVENGKHRTVVYRSQTFNVINNKGDISYEQVEALISCIIGVVIELMEIVRESAQMKQVSEELGRNLGSIGANLQSDRVIKAQIDAAKLFDGGDDDDEEDDESNLGPAITIFAWPKATIDTILELTEKLPI